MLCMYHGICCTGKNTPLKNSIGNMSVIITIIATILLAVKSMGRDGGERRGGGIILIGPIPIIFGSDRETVKGLIYLAIALILLLIIYTVITQMF